jgi:hypothetical protein
MSDTAPRAHRVSNTHWLHGDSPRSVQAAVRNGLGKKIFKKTRQKALLRAHKPAG